VIGPLDVRGASTAIWLSHPVGLDGVVVPRRTHTRTPSAFGSAPVQLTSTELVPELSIFGVTVMLLTGAGGAAAPPGVAANPAPTSASMVKPVSCIHIRHL